MKPEIVAASSLFSEPPPVNPAAVAAAESVAGSVPPVGAPGSAPVASVGSSVGGPIEQPTGGPTGPAPETDAAGVPFDPDRHIPKRHPKSGRWMPKRPARTGGTTGGTGGGPGNGSVVGTDPGPIGEPTGPTDPTGTGQPAESGPDVFSVMADLHCRAFYGVSVAFLSDEWLATKEEHRTNVETLAAYYRATGMRPDSPGWALLVQGVAFAGKRLTMPKTQTRLGMLRSWIAARWASWRGARRASQLAQIGAQ